MARLHKSSVVYVKYPSNTRKLPISKAWKLKNVSLFQEPESKRTYLEISPVNTQENNSKVEVNTVNITDVKNIYRTRSKSHKFAFVLDVNSPLIFLAGLCESESQEWMRAIRNVLWAPLENVSDSLKEEDYYVSLIETPSSIQAGLTGLYGLMRIKSGRVTVQPVSNKVHQVNWTLPSIRQLYLATAQSPEDRDKIFMLQTQDNSSGDYGEFCFYSRFAREILRSFYVGMQSDINGLPSPGKCSPNITPKMPRSRTEVTMCHTKRKKERTRGKKRRGVSLTPTRHCQEKLASSLTTAWKSNSLRNDSRRSLSESNILCVESETRFVHSEHHYEEIGVPVPSGSFDALAEESNEECDEQSKDVEVLQGRALSCGSHNSCDSGVRSSDNMVYSSDENDGGHRLRYGYSRLKGDEQSIIEDNLAEELSSCEIMSQSVLEYHICESKGYESYESRNEKAVITNICDTDSGSARASGCKSNNADVNGYAKICKHKSKLLGRRPSLESNTSGSALYEEIPFYKQEIEKMKREETSHINNAPHERKAPPPLPPRRPTHMSLTGTKSGGSVRKFLGLMSRDYRDKGYVTPEEENKNFIYQVACTPRRGKRYPTIDYLGNSVRTLPRNWRMSKKHELESRMLGKERSTTDSYSSNASTLTRGVERLSCRSKRDDDKHKFAGEHYRSYSACSSPSESPSLSRKIRTQGQTLMRRFSRERSSDRKLRKNWESASLDKPMTPQEPSEKHVSRSHTFWDFRDRPKVRSHRLSADSEPQVELRGLNIPRRAISDPLSSQALLHPIDKYNCSLCEFNRIVEKKSVRQDSRFESDPSAENPYLAMDKGKRMETKPSSSSHCEYLDMNQIQSAKKKEQNNKYSNKALISPSAPAPPPHSYVTMAQLKKLGETLLSPSDYAANQHSKESDYVEMGDSQPQDPSEATDSLK